MGKDLKGKKLPAGICQRKDGLYSARFTSKTGRRVEKFFKKDLAGDFRTCKYWDYYEFVCSQHRRRERKRNQEV